MASPGSPAPVIDVQEQIRRRMTPVAPPSPGDPRMTNPVQPKFPTRGPAGINNPVFSTQIQPGDYTQPGAPIQEPAPTAAPAAPPAPAPAPAPVAGPQISSGQAGAKGIEDMWFQFLNSGGYATGQAGNGFYSGGGKYRGNLGGVVDAFNQATGSHARTVTGHDDQIDFGNGAQDVLQAGTDNWWLSPSSGSSSPIGGGAGAPGAGGGSAAGAGVSDFQNQLRQMIMKRLAATQQPVDENSPEVSAQFTGAATQAARGLDQERKALAERLAANGDTSGSLQQGIQQSAERNAMGLGTLKGQLIGRQIESQKAEFQGLMAQALQSGDNEAARQIQMRIAEMDSELRRLGLSQQQSQFDDNFGLEAGRFQYGKDRDVAIFGAGGN